MKPGRKSISFARAPYVVPLPIVVSNPDGSIEYPQGIEAVFAYIMRAPAPTTELLPQ